MDAAIKIFKIGGSVIEQPDLLASFLEEFAQLQSHKILVHGGGRSATAMADQLGISSKMIEGRRVTDEVMLDIVVMVYGGLNKKIVAQLQSRACNAVGLTGADLNVMKSRKRPPDPVDYGLVGDIASVNAPALTNLLDQHIVPVMAPLTHDGKGQILNTNADNIAGSLARSLAEYRPVELFYCFEKKGVMHDPDDDKTLIKTMTPIDFANLKSEGVVVDGMIPKLENAFKTLEAGVNKVYIMHHEEIKSVRAGVIDGTTLTLE